MFGVGGAKRDRTADLLRAKQALSQLSYGPSDNHQHHEDVHAISMQTRRRDATCVSNTRAAVRRRIHRNMVGLSRLELPTSPLSGVRSNHLSYRPTLACLFSGIRH